MSSNQYLRYQKAKTNALYELLVNKATERLRSFGHFSKEAALKDAGLDVIAEEMFRWDYIKRMIEENENTELIPLAGAFFKRHTAEVALQFPGKFIAAGHGKKTAGFCIASQVNGHFVLEQLKLKTGKAAGMMRSADKTRRVGRAAGVEGLGGGSLLPAPGSASLPPAPTADDEAA